MRILQVTYENFKNIRNGKYDLNGKSVLLIADNAFGKTNFMRGLRGVLGANPGKNLITEGQDKATVTAVLAEFENDTPVDNTLYTFKMSVKKDRGGDEKVTLSVRTPDGEKFDTKTMVGKLAGEIEIAQGDFVALGKDAPGRAKQLEVFKSYLDAELLAVLNTQRKDIQRFYDLRTEVGRERDRLGALIESSGLKFSDWTTYKDPIAAEPQMELINNAATHNTQYKGVQMRVQDRNLQAGKNVQEVNRIKDEIAALTLQCEKLESENIQLSRQNAEANKWLTENHEIDVSAAQAELTRINDHNAMHKRVVDAGKWKAEHEAAVDKYGHLGADHDTAVETWKNAIREMQHPIEGFSIDEREQVFFNGKLIDEDHLSFAEQKMVNIALKKAKNPNAHVLFIDNGESIGQAYMDELQEFADTNGYQLIIEEMQRGKNELVIQMMPSRSNTQIAVNK